MITIEILDKISDDFQSTFTFIDPQTIANIMVNRDFDEVTRILKKYLGNVSVEFQRKDPLSKDPEKSDIWIIRVSQPAV